MIDKLSRDEEADLIIEKLKTTPKRRYLISPDVSVREVFSKIYSSGYIRDIIEKVEYDEDR